MSKVRIMVDVGLPQDRGSEKCLPISIEDKVRNTIELIDSGKESYVEWLMLNKMYRSLCEMEKPTRRVKNLISMIEPVLAKFGYHKTEAVR